MALIAIAAFALLLVVVAMTARPLLQPRTTAPRRDDRDTPELLVRKARLLDAIREADMDLATGKLSDADHAQMRAELVAEATAVLEQIDRTAPHAPADEPSVEAAATPTGSDADAPAGAVQPAAEQRVEEEIARRRQLLTIERTCPACDGPREDGDAFCRRCGAQLHDPEEVSS